MNQSISIGIIGDFDTSHSSHKATNDAIKHAALLLSLKASVTWLPTLSFLTLGEKELDQFDGFWASPGSPYRSTDGALRGIQYAREMNRPFIGT